MRKSFVSLCLLSLLLSTAPLFAQELLQDYVADVDVRINAPGDAGLILRDSVSCAISSDVLTLTIADQAPITTPFSAQTGQWYHLRGTAIGNRVTCEVAGSPSARLTVTTAPRTGSVTLLSTNALADLNNLQVVKLDQSGRLVFIRNGDVWTVLTDGTNEKQLTTGGGAGWPRTAAGVVTFTRAGHLWLTDLSGAAPVMIPDTSGICEYDLSPDGQHLVLTYTNYDDPYSTLNFSMYTMGTDGSNKTLLHRHDNYHQIEMSWARDGNVYFGESRFLNSSDKKLYRMPSDGSAVPLQLTSYYSEWPAFGGPVGRVLFAYQPSPSPIRMMDADGSDQVNVPAPPVDFRPDYDGQYETAYYRYNNAIWRENTDGSNNIEIVSNVTSCYIDWGPANPPDKIPPAITAPSDVTAEATSNAGAAVSFTVTAKDDVDGDVPVTCAPSSGSQFSLGTTTVNCTAKDAAGNTSTASFPVHVVDTTAPAVSTSGDVTVEATSHDGATATFSATATDIVDGTVSATCAPVSGSLFPLGTTKVTCTATDAAGNQGSAYLNVHVVDLTPPVVTVPADITAEATSPSGAVVTFSASATDAIDGDVPVTCTPASGSQFALGTTTVVCIAVDASGNSASGSFAVHVVDTTPPVLWPAANPNVLWPPNHKMVNVTVTVNATDAADTAIDSHITKVTSNEPSDGEPDWIITGRLTLQLRAERLGTGSGRVYTITVEGVDDSGNRSTATTTVRVPHDQGR